MDQKTAEKLKMTQPMSQTPWSKTRWIVGTVLVVLLVGIIVTSTLIGVYMTQKHTEKMVTLAYDDRDGQRVQQIISVNEQENMAAFFVRSGNYSFTVLYDYRRNIIGIRQANSRACYVLRMEGLQTPSLHDILRQIENIKTQNGSTDGEITYNITPEKKVNPTDVGMSVNILCSDVTIYWAKSKNSGDVRRWKWPKIKLPKIKIKVDIGIEIGRK